jgi:broad specificity phosphatase PhoE
MPSLSVIIAAFAPVFFSLHAYFILLAIFIGIIIVLLMRPRRFYFVRHGETILNAAHIKQGEEGGLSESGKQQAVAVGEALASLDIHTVISSPYERARETALIINNRLHASIIYSPLLAERRNPSEVLGEDRDDPEVVRIIDQMDLAYHTDDYRFSDEENFIDLKERARKCLNFLVRKSARETVVITHHAFLKMLIAYLLYRDRLHATDFVKLSFFNVSDNAGITVCEFHPWKLFSPTFGWEVVSYNQQP